MFYIRNRKIHKDGRSLYRHLFIKSLNCEWEINGFLFNINI